MEIKTFVVKTYETLTHTHNHTIHAKAKVHWSKNAEDSSGNMVAQRLLHIRQELYRWWKWFNCKIFTFVSIMQRDNWSERANWISLNVFDTDEMLVARDWMMNVPKLNFSSMSCTYIFASTPCQRVLYWRMAFQWLYFVTEMWRTYEADVSTCSISISLWA